MHGANLRVKLKGRGNYSHTSFLIANKQITSLWCLDLNGRFNSENRAHSRANLAISCETFAIYSMNFMVENF